MHATKKTTKLILCFICVVDILRSLCFPCFCLSQLRILVHPLVWYVEALWPFLKNSDFYYTVYCAHRYAVIVDQFGIFKIFKKVASLLGIFLLGVVYGYLVEFNIIFNCYVYVAYHWHVLHFIVRSILMFGQTSLHWYGIRSITKKLDETISFLKSLPDSHRHDNRLKALGNLKRLNKGLFFLQVLMPTLEVIWHTFCMIYPWVYMTYCKNCQHSMVAEFDVYLLPHLSSTIMSTRSIIFVVLHLLYYKVFSRCGTTES